MALEKALAHQNHKLLLCVLLLARIPYLDLLKEIGLTSSSLATATRTSSLLQLTSKDPRTLRGT